MAEFGKNKGLIWNRIEPKIKETVSWTEPNWLYGDAPSFQWIVAPLMLAKLYSKLMVLNEYS